MPRSRRAATRGDAHRALAEFVGWYNGERRHSTLGYVSPAQYERQHERQPADMRRAA